MATSGKTGKGFLPIDNEPIVSADNYSNDRIFYYLRSAGKHDPLVEKLLAKNFPVIVTDLDNKYQLSAEMYKWEFAIAAACSFIGVNPFNQPNVQESKSITHKMIDAYKKKPVLEDRDVLFEDDEIIVSGNLKIDWRKDRLDQLIDVFLAPKNGDYFAINAFLPRLGEYEQKLQKIRKHLLEKYQIPVTLGYGPRFLHSTGQLHKGGKNNGLFVIITQDSPIDFVIPGDKMQFSVLQRAQALGDMRALEQNDRRVIHVHIKGKTLLEFDPALIFTEF